MANPPTTSNGQPDRRYKTDGLTRKQIGEALGVSSGAAGHWIKDGVLTGQETIEWILAHRDELLERRRVLGMEKRLATYTSARLEAEQKRRAEAVRRREEKERQRRAELQRLREEAEQRREEDSPVSYHTKRAEARAAARAEFEELVASGQLKVRKATAEDFQRLEQARARRLLPDDRQAA